MKKILIAILMSLAILPSMATQINVRTKATLPRGGARMPSITHVSADYENGFLTVNVQKYLGMVWVYIYDADGSVIGENAANIISDGSVSTDITHLKKGDYTLRVVLSDTIYEGTFKIS